MKKEDPLVRDRARKFEEIKKTANPYPSRFDKKDLLGKLREKYDNIKVDTKTKKSVKTAGRIISMRGMGRLAFFDVIDATGKMQCCMSDKDCI
jgi:lysyl-tRNA synthetase, class II